MNSPISGEIDLSGSDEIIGDIAQGALTARALEPAHGEGSGDGHTHEAACLNCGTALLGSHCHACGQAAHVHRTLGAFFHDLLHGVFHFEGKIWRTLPMLAWQPGRLTREYIDGRRASYVSPIALFLFGVFLMFAVIKQVGGTFDPNQTVDLGAAGSAGIAETEQQLKELRAERAKLVAAGQRTEAVDQKIATEERGLEILREVKGANFSQSTAQSDIPALDRMLKAFAANPKLVIYKLQSSAYKYSWALIPISVPFVWLLFPFSRRFHLYDHTVFVTYSLCFMTLLAVVLTLANAAGVPWIGMAATVLPPWHMYRQLRGTYGLTRGATIWRTGALLIISLTALLLFAVLILAEAGA